MPQCTLSKWDDSGARTENFSVVFKALDFGNSTEFKKISNIYLTFNNQSSTTTLLTLHYRSNATSDFTTIGTIQSTTSGTEEIKEVKLSPIIKVKTFQLKITGLQYTEGDFSISDVNILYRPLRDYSTDEI